MGVISVVGVGVRIYLLRQLFGLPGNSSDLLVEVSAERKATEIINWKVH